MWAFLSNSVVSHVLCLGLGAVGGWVATHLTAIKLAETNAKKDVAVAITDAKKDL